MKRLDLTLDLGIYIFLYICFLEFIFPLLSYILASAGINMPLYAHVSWSLCNFFVNYFYVHLVILLFILMLYELFLGKISYISKMLIKLFSALFLIYNFSVIPFLLKTAHAL